MYLTLDCIFFLQTPDKMNTNELLGVNLIILSRRTSTKYKHRVISFVQCRWGEIQLALLVLTIACVYICTPPTNHPFLVCFENGFNSVAWKPRRCKQDQMWSNIMSADTDQNISSLQWLESSINKNDLIPHIDTGMSQVGHSQQVSNSAV